MYGPICLMWYVSPWPLHLTHGFGCRPGFAPVPVQVVQVRVRSTRSVLCAPVYNSSSVTESST